VDEHANCIRLEKIKGNKMDFYDIFKEIQGYLQDANMIV